MKRTFKSPKLATLDTHASGQANASEVVDLSRSQSIAISDDTKALIQGGVSENTLRNYRFWSKEIEQWLQRGNGTLIGALGYDEKRTLNDATLAEYITKIAIGRRRAAVQMNRLNRVPCSEGWSGAIISRPHG